MGYEGRDNLASVTDALLPANSEAFTYTPRESLSGATGPYGTLAYTYDGVGNRLTASISGAADAYSYLSTSNQLATITLATGGTRGFGYDAAGNVIAEARPGGTYSYTYNAAGRMSEFRINGVLQASYKYDAMGRQAIRSLTSPTPVTIHSVFDSQGRRIAEYDEASGALLREYVWTGWEPVAVIEGGVVSFVRTDHIGRPVFATNATGAKVWEVSYLPFGSVHVASGNAISARFPGQWFQSESGLHQNWMRDYDPTTGRYLEPDPLALIDGASVYGYVRQNPGRSIDPKGLQAITLPFPGAGVGTGIGTGLGGTFDIAPMTNFGPGYRTETQEKQADREYKDFCDHMGPGSPPSRTADPEAYCKWVASALSHASECVHRIKEFDRRWSAGRHDQKISEWINRIDWLRKEQDSFCSNCSTPTAPPTGFGITDPVHSEPKLYYCDLQGRCYEAI